MAKPSKKAVNASAAEQEHQSFAAQEHQEFEYRMDEELETSRQEDILDAIKLITNSSSKYNLAPPLAEYDEQGFCIKEGFSLVYQCDHNTREYTGATFISRIVGVGLPADAFLDIPSHNEIHDQTAVIRAPDNQSWLYLDDYRGRDSYHTQTGELQKVDYLGKIKDGYTLEKPGSKYDVFFTDGIIEKWTFDAAKEKTALISAAKAEKSRLLKVAEEQIEHLGDLIADDEATAAEKALSKEWRSYRAALRKIKPDEIEDYHNIVLPTPPALAFDDDEHADFIHIELPPGALA